MSDHLGVGPDGANLLGFLASVGAFVGLSDAWPGRGVRMSWIDHAGWHPIWHVAGESTEDDVVRALLPGGTRRKSGPEFSGLGADLPVSPEVFRAFAAGAAGAARPSNRRWADFAAAFGCEATGDDERIQDTAFRTMSGAGHQHLLTFFQTLAQVTTADDLRRALFAPWLYEDEGPTLRWDPVDDRRYAYRADDPAKSTTHPIRTVRGANRLAQEALMCFPTAPQGRRLQTTGFQREEREWAVQWPIWSPPLSLPTLRSLLTHPALAECQVDHLRALGVVEVFRSRRITERFFRSFAPAEARLGGRTADDRRLWNAGRGSPSNVERESPSITA